MISNLNKRKAIIFGIKGTNLSYEMKLFLKSENPWGIILFSRNVKDFFQSALIGGKMHFEYVEYVNHLYAIDELIHVHSK